jgi:hypothetical protein
MCRLALVGGFAGALISACGASGMRRSASPAVARASRLPADYLPLTVGPGRGYQPEARTGRVRAGQPVDGLTCRPAAGTRFGAHMEIFAHRHVVAIPAGIGVALPVTAVAGRISTGRCRYPVMTTDPSGVLAVQRTRRVTLGEVFDLWGQPLTRNDVAGFRGPLAVYVGTRRWHGDPRAIVLSRHERIVLELATRIPPHRAYVFPPGL